MSCTRFANGCSPTPAAIYTNSWPVFATVRSPPAACGAEGGERVGAGSEPNKAMQRTRSAGR